MNVPRYLFVNPNAMFLQVALNFWLCPIKSHRATEINIFMFIFSHMQLLHIKVQSGFDFGAWNRRRQKSHLNIHKNVWELNLYCLKTYCCIYILTHYLPAEGLPSILISWIAKNNMIYVNNRTEVSKGKEKRTSTWLDNATPHQNSWKVSRRGDVTQCTAHIKLANKLL